MKITVSVAGVFHAYQLAEQLHRHGALERLVTTYPRGWIRHRMGIDLPAARIRTHRLHGLLVALRRLGLDTAGATRAYRRFHGRYACASVQEGLDLFVGWSDCSLPALEKARGLGVTTAVVRGSAHIRAQRDLLAEEYDRFGLPFAIDPATVEQELQEYEIADWVQTNSSFARDTMIAQGIAADRILMTPTGVDLSRFQPTARRDDTFRVIFAGALSVRKGVRYLLEAWQRLGLPDAELWLLGRVTDPLRPLLEQYADPSIHVLGHRPMTELPSLYSQGSVFCLPSIEEGLAVVQAQAMACGLPLLCTPNTGGGDFLSEDGAEGFVVPIRDPEALAERIVWLYEHREACQAMGQAARARVQAGFSWDDYGDRIMALYAGLPGMEGLAEASG